MKIRMLAILVAAIASAPARADTLRDLCADRPGLGTPACTLDRGHWAVEIGAADWTSDRQGPERTDTIQIGEMLVRAGVSDAAEIQIGWTAFGHVRVEDRASGIVERQSGIGDVTLALRQNLHNPDGSGFAAAIMPYATVPVGGAAVGAGDWGAGLIVPMSFDLGESGVSLALTAQIDAAPDADRDGRHLGYGAIAGLGVGLSGALSVSAELSLYRDQDPLGHSSEAIAGLSLGWQASADSQWDVGANLGINRDSPDVELYFGIVRRF